MTPRWKRRLRAGLAPCVAAGIILLVALRQGEDYAGEIRSGKLAYTSKAGWVNWGHARSDGVRRFLDDLRARWKQAAGGAFTVSYAQRMSCHWGWLGVESRVRRTYVVAGGLRAEELDRVGWGIFREVSAAFEEMQGRFPDSIDARSQSSSFRAGDLAGDRVAFYCASRGCRPETVREWLGVADIAGSLREWARRGVPSQRS